MAPGLDRVGKTSPVDRLLAHAVGLRRTIGPVRTGSGGSRRNGTTISLVRPVDHPQPRLISLRGLSREIALDVCFRPRHPPAPGITQTVGCRHDAFEDEPTPDDRYWPAPSVYSRSDERPVTAPCCPVWGHTDRDQAVGNEGRSPPRSARCSPRSRRLGHALTLAFGRWARRV